VIASSSVAEIASVYINRQADLSTSIDILEKDLKIYSGINYPPKDYLGEYPHTGVIKGGYQIAEYVVQSESNYKAAEYKSVYEP
jgi:hypothetical protein